MKIRNINTYICSLFFGLLLCISTSQAQPDYLTPWSVYNRTNYDLSTTPNIATDKGVIISPLKFLAYYKGDITSIITNHNNAELRLGEQSISANAGFTEPILISPLDFLEGVPNGWAGAILVNNVAYLFRETKCRIPSKNAVTEISIYRKQNGEFWAFINSKNTDGTALDNYNDYACHVMLIQRRLCIPGSRIGQGGRDVCPADGIVF